MTAEIRRQLRYAEVMRFFAAQPACLVGMEGHERLDGIVSTSFILHRGCETARSG